MVSNLFQLKNLIHRTNVPSDPQKNMNAAEDFLLVLLHAHVTDVTAAAKTVLDSVGRVDHVKMLARLVLANYFLPPRFDCDSNDGKTKDGVHLYAKELLTLGLVWHGFHDASREGDGDRLFRCCTRVCACMSLISADLWCILQIILEILGNHF